MPLNYIRLDTNNFLEIPAMIFKIISRIGYAKK
jgi:hypothetical protein